jgi:Uma2 family endonuclease
MTKGNRVSALPETHQPMTEAEYLALERASETKHEFIGGEVYAMTGASRRHNLIVAGGLGALLPQLRDRDCELYPSDMKVRTP